MTTVRGLITPLRRVGCWNNVFFLEPLPPSGKPAELPGQLLLTRSEGSYGPVVTPRILGPVRGEAEMSMWITGLRPDILELAQQLGSSPEATREATLLEDWEEKSAAAETPAGAVVETQGLFWGPTGPSGHGEVRARMDAQAEHILNRQRELLELAQDCDSIPEVVRRLEELHRVKTVFVGHLLELKNYYDPGWQNAINRRYLLQEIQEDLEPQEWQGYVDDFITMAHNSHAIRTAPERLASQYLLKVALKLANAPTF
jgi:hypothetical protein